MALSESWEALCKWFWNEDVWLPPGFRWEDVRDTSKVKYAQFEELYHASYVAIILLIIRFALERFIFKPVGVYLGLKDRRSRNVTEGDDGRKLEKAFLHNGHNPSHQELAGIAKQLDWSERRVQRWWRDRLRLEKPSTLDKFSESAWRCSFYLAVFCYGLYCLSDKPWLWDTMHCWYNFPHHDMTSDVWWYYMIELGFYLSLMFSQFLDVKRKDFWQMFVHHIVTILLMAFSWTCNFTRIGSLVMLVHDFADIPLEAAKMAKYVKSQKMADLLFVVFTLSWVVSRLGLYPYRVIYSTMYQAVFVIEMFAAYYIFNSLLIALQILHIVWTIFIVKIVIQALSSQGIKDLRSEDESSTSEGDKED